MEQQEPFLNKAQTPLETNIIYLPFSRKHRMCDKLVRLEYQKKLLLYPNIDI